MLGVRSDIILQKFITCRPVRFELADGPAVYSALIVDIDDKTDMPVAVERILIKE